ALGIYNFYPSTSGSRPDSVPKETFICIAWDATPNSRYNLFTRFKASGSNRSRSRNLAKLNTSHADGSLFH
ncbi:hypothetical protein L9F63_019074, partial [Diploptera punctata]